MATMVMVIRLVLTLALRVLTGLWMSLQSDRANGNNDNEDEASTNSDWSLNSEEAAIFAQLEAEMEAGII
jgi:uncharacterized membrane protein YraQ (UPF0718 family)